MKNVLKIVAFLFISLTLNAQDFQGEAVYKSHRKMDFKMDGVEEGSEMQKQIQAQLAKQFQKEYTLKFNRVESVYKQNESLAAPAPGNSMITIEVNEGSDLLYKNIKSQTYLNEVELYGKQFLINDDIEPIKWELSNETKSIGVYTCRKASFKKTYKTQSLNDNGQFEEVEKERETVAWYTMEIPIANGPSNFQGLPGLILEINDGELTLVCTKITLNPDKKFELEMPSKGKKVSQEAFEKIANKKSKEMMERFHSKRGDDSHAIFIGG